MKESVESKRVTIWFCRWI